VSEIAETKARKDHSTSHDEDEPMSDREHEERTGGGGPGVSEEPESEEGVDSQAEDDHIRRKDTKRTELRRNHDEHFRPISSSKHNHHYHYHHQKSRSMPFVGPGSGSGQRYVAVGGGGMSIPLSPSSYRHHHEGRSNGGSGSQNRAVRPWDEELDADGELDAEGDYLNDDRLPPPRSMNRSIPRRPWPIGLADLDSPSGR
jgi:hypothetical protein